MKRIFLPTILFINFNAVLAQISITTTGSTTQDFNTLANSGTGNVFNNNSTLTGWFWQQQLNEVNTYDANSGNGVAGRKYSYGTGTATDRALGQVTSGTTLAIASGILFQNNSSQTITDIKVSYTGEQWRSAGVATGQRFLRFHYLVSAAPISSLSPGTTTGWTAVSALDFATPVFSTTAGSLDGNNVANRTVFSSVSLPSLSLPPGSYIMLRWQATDDLDNDPGMAIDDVTISYIQYLLFYHFILLILKLPV